MALELYFIIYATINNGIFKYVRLDDSEIKQIRFISSTDILFRDKYISFFFDRITKAVVRSYLWTAVDIYKKKRKKTDKRR